MNNKEKIIELQTQINLLNKQERDERVSKVTPKYEGKFFKCSASYMHIIKIENASEDGSIISVRSNDIDINPFGIGFNLNRSATVNTEYIQEITEAEFKRITLLNTSNIIDQL